MKAKQIQNCLDTVSAQEVTGEKHFAAPQTFAGEPKSIVIHDGFIYWATNPQVLNENGNTRLSMVSGSLQTEIYDAGRWNQQ
jgi:hypothetical protein